MLYFQQKIRTQSNKSKLGALYNQFERGTHGTD